MKAINQGGTIMDGHQLLIVDDQPSIRYFLSELLVGAGFAATAVESGESALPLLETGQFDVALLDLKMHGMDGLEVMQRIKACSPETQVIIHTGHGSMAAAIEALRQGAHDFLLKPCEPDVIRKSIDAALRKHDIIKNQQANVTYFANVAHDLRTPLSSIEIMIELLEKQRFEAYPHYLELLREATSQMASLIDSTLTLSEVGKSYSAYMFTPESLNTLVRFVVAGFVQQANAKGLTLDCDLWDDVPTVMLLRQPFLQLVTNLVNNALKYTITGGVLVSTYPDTSHNKVCVQVEDTGIGINAEDIPHLFDRFFRCDNARSMNVQGNGVGLSIVKEIVDVHRGEITVTSELGKGSIFRVWLPVTQEVEALCHES